jgi:hypothetical protein
MKIMMKIPALDIPLTTIPGSLSFMKKPLSFVEFVALGGPGKKPPPREGKGYGWRNFG